MPIYVDVGECGDLVRELRLLRRIAAYAPAAGLVLDDCGCPRCVVWRDGEVV